MYQLIFIYSSLNLLIVVMMLEAVLLTIRKLLTRFSTMVFKWLQNGISGNLRMVLQDYLDEGRESVVL